MFRLSRLFDGRERDGVLQEMALVEAEYDRLAANPGFQGSPVGKQAAKLLKTAREQTRFFGDTEASWSALHGARRFLLYGLSQSELELRKVSLAGEVVKLTNWRRKSAEELLKLAASAAVLFEVATHLDTNSRNAYQKIWLRRDHFLLLATFVFAGSVLLAPLCFWVHANWAETATEGGKLAGWSITMLSAVAYFGLLGGVFSSAQSLLTATAVKTVPESVSSQSVLLLRCLCGL